MTPGYKEFEDFLRTVHRRKADNIQGLIKSASNKVLKSIIEIAYNLLKGSIPLKESDIKSLKQDKELIKSLIRKRVRLGKKRRIIEENPHMLKRMLNVIFR